MESSLLFFLVGLGIFGAKILTRGRPGAIRLLVFVAGGALSGLIIGLFSGSSLFMMFRIPWGIMPIIGATAGLVLYGADKSELIHKPGIQYAVTILLGSVLAGLSYGIISIYRMVSSETQTIFQPRNIIVLSYLLIGFLSVFGFTFPERWFKRREGG